MLRRNMFQLYMVAPGDYEYSDLCDMLASKYIPDGIYTVTLVIEEPSSDFVMAEQLNSGC